MDSIGLDLAALINYVAADVMGFTSQVNQFISNYVKEDPNRLISRGSVHLRQSINVQRDLEGRGLVPGASSSKCFSRHQRYTPKDLAKILSPIGRDCAQNAFRH